MLSGIGPPDELRRHHIPVQHGLPGVGENLQDHLAAGVMYRCRRSVSLDKSENLFNLLRYALFKTGPFCTNVAEAGAFVATNPADLAANLQFHFAPALYVDHGFVRPKIYGLTITPTLVSPQSRGRIRLHSSDPFAAPLIEPNYLSEHHDRSILKHGIELAIEIAHQPAFAPYLGAPFEPEKEPTSHADIESFIRAQAESLYHSVGTCRMGNDELAVVDSRLRVRGIERLRVVDASIMPTIVNGNTNAACTMIGELGARAIVAET